MVSVVIPTFNRAFFLKKAIESVLAQSHQGFEIIVIDDGSEDNTREVVDSYSGRIIYIKQKNKGPASARNLGILKSRGELIAFLDSDDWWDKGKLELQVGEMERNPGYLISHTQEIWYKKGSILNQKKKHQKPSGCIFDKSLSLCAVSMSTAMARRQIFKKIGVFDESLPCCEDYDFWLRVAALHEFLLIDQPLTMKDGGRPDQVSFIHRHGMDKFRIYSIDRILESGVLDETKRGLAIKELEKKCGIYSAGCFKHGKEKEGAYYLRLPEKYLAKTHKA